MTTEHTKWKMESKIEMKERNIEILDQINVIVRASVFFGFCVYPTAITNAVHFEVVLVLKMNVNKWPFKFIHGTKMCNPKRNGTEQNLDLTQKTTAHLFIIIFETVLPIRVNYYVRFLKLKFHSS